MSFGICAICGKDGADYSTWKFVYHWDCAKCLNCGQAGHVLWKTREPPYMFTCLECGQGSICINGEFCLISEFLKSEDK